MRRLPLAAVIACLGAGACATSYQPQPSPRVGIVIHHGAAMYVKNGQEVPIGPLGGALEPMIETSPEAVSHAQRARRQLAFGVPLYIAGAVTVILGLASSRSSPAVRWTLIGVGAGSGGTGVSLMGAGVTNLVDALNIYNDSATAARK